MNITENKVYYPDNEPPLWVGDIAQVVEDQQYNDDDDNNCLPRCFGKEGRIIKIDSGDVWKYQLEFSDGTTNWFKRRHLKKLYY